VGRVLLGEKRRGVVQRVEQRVAERFDNQAGNQFVRLSPAAAVREYYLVNFQNPFSTRISYSI
jgi:N12 class adenine-specific DNA methylase